VPAVPDVVHVELWQVRSDVGEEPAARTQRILTQLRDRREQLTPPTVIVLPELWQAGAFATAAVLAHAEPLTGPTVAALSEAAVARGCWLHAGSIAERHPSGAVTNTALLINPSGELIGCYRKIHLFGFDTGEARHLRAGEQVCVVDTPFGRTGLATCYDLRFPELFRAMVDQGAQTFLMCSGWPVQRIDAWQVLTRARAIENQAWVIACNGVGSHPVGEAGGDTITLGGASVIVDPWGAVLAEGTAGEQVVSADVDPAAPSGARQRMPFLRDRVLR